MRGNAALASRIARLEAQRRRFKRRLPRLTFSIYPDQAPGDVQGFANSRGLMVPREPGEALSAVQARAWRHPDAGQALFAVYPPDEASEAGPGQSEPSPEPEPNPDPYALAGIGREDAKYRGSWRSEGSLGQI